MQPTDLPLCEEFQADAIDSRLQWLNPPPGWRLGPFYNGLQVETAAGTDFWQRTHYGFQADNGHFLALSATGDFCLTTKVTSHPVHQYDQAGLMIRISPDCWLKTSVEYEPDGPNRLGVVVTNAGYSDWSTQSLASDITTIWLRIRAEAADAIVEWSMDSLRWEQLRVAHLLARTSADFISCGLYACSPKGAGFRAEFAFLDFQPGRIKHETHA